MFKPGFHMIVTVTVSICRRLIGDTSPMCRSRSPTVHMDHMETRLYDHMETSTAKNGGISTCSVC